MLTLTLWQCFGYTVDAMLVLYFMWSLIATSPEQVYDLCPESNVWYFVLSHTLYFVWNRMYGWLYPQKLDANGLTPITPMFVTRVALSVCLLVWGFNELFMVKCITNLNIPNEKPSILYTSLQIMAYSDLFIYGLIVTMMLSVIVVWIMVLIEAVYKAINEFRNERQQQQQSYTYGPVTDENLPQQIELLNLIARDIET